jgi:hypothetical protein
VSLRYFAAEEQLVASLVALRIAHSSTNLEPIGHRTSKHWHIYPEFLVLKMVKEDSFERTVTTINWHTKLQPWENIFLHYKDKVFQYPMLRIGNAFRVQGEYRSRHSLGCLPLPRKRHHNSGTTSSGWRPLIRHYLWCRTRRSLNQRLGWEDAPDRRPATLVASPSQVHSCIHVIMIYEWREYSNSHDTYVMYRPRNSSMSVTNC